jgi:protein gp37
MADGTKIEWTDATWNILNGCSVLSPGCANCYAMRLAGTRLRHHPSRRGLTVDSRAGPVWTGEVRLHEPWLAQPLGWSRPRSIFVAAHGDLFHDAVTDEMLDKVFAVIVLCATRQIGHRFQILTKRSARMRRYLTRFEGRPDEFGRALAYVVRLAGLDREEGLRAIAAMTWPLPNVWVGVSAEDQRRADERIPDLMATPAAIRWLSAEPLLGSIILSGGYDPQTKTLTDYLTGDVQDGVHERGDGYVTINSRFWTGPKLDWVVVGGESGPGARHMHPDWVVSLHDQCKAAGTPFLFKQWGHFLPHKVGTAEADSIRYPPGHVIYNAVGKKAAGRKLFGRTHDGIPT